MHQPGPCRRGRPAHPGDDTPINLVLGGRAAASVKEAICKGTLWAIRREAAKPGSYFWLKGGRRPGVPADQQVALR